MGFTHACLIFIRAIHRHFPHTFLFLRELLQGRSCSETTRVTIKSGTDHVVQSPGSMQPSYFFHHHILLIKDHPVVRAIPFNCTDLPQTFPVQNLFDETLKYPGLEDVRSNPRVEPESASLAKGLKITCVTPASARSLEESWPSFCLMPGYH